MRFGQEVGARAAWLPGFEFQTVTHTTGVIFEDLARGSTKRQFPQTRIFHPTGEAHQLGASIFTFRDVPHTTSMPLARIAGTLHRVSTLLTQVGLPHTPEVRP